MTMYRSRLNIINPHTTPNKTETKTDLKTEKRANPPAIAAKMPVKKTVAPMLAYLLTSVGVLLRIDLSAPAQKRKKEVRPFIIISFQVKKMNSKKKYQTKILFDKIAA
jgi:hypothetical protein